MRWLLLIAASVTFVSADDKLNRNVILRGSYANSQLQFDQLKTGRVAFMGGSITQMNGYRPMVATWLQKRFPKTKFDFINAGISSTCSTTGAFRLPSEVLAKGKIDLFFIEFAVNDDQDASHASRECVRGMEGIIRQARKAQPNMDIVVTHFVNPGMLEQLREGKMPLSMAAHEKVLKAYNVSTIFLAREVADRIDAGKLTWVVFGGTHPKPAGNAIAADMIGHLLDRAWSKRSRPSRHRMRYRGNQWMKAVISADIFFYQRPAQMRHGRGTNRIGNRYRRISKRSFCRQKLLTATLAGQEATVHFNGARWEPMSWLGRMPGCWK